MGTTKDPEGFLRHTSGRRQGLGEHPGEGGPERRRGCGLGAALVVVGLGLAVAAVALAGIAVSGCGSETTFDSLDAETQNLVRFESGWQCEVSRFAVDDGLGGIAGRERELDRSPPGADHVAAAEYVARLEEVPAQLPVQAHLRQAADLDHARQRLAGSLDHRRR